MAAVAQIRFRQDAEPMLSKRWKSKTTALKLVTQQESPDDQARRLRRLIETIVSESLLSLDYATTRDSRCDEVFELINILNEVENDVDYLDPAEIVASHVGEVDAWHQLMETNAFLHQASNRLLQTIVSESVRHAHKEREDEIADAYNWRLRQLKFSFIAFQLGAKWANQEVSSTAWEAAVDDLYYLPREMHILISEGISLRRSQRSFTFLETADAMIKNGMLEAGLGLLVDGMAARVGHHNVKDFVRRAAGLKEPHSEVLHAVGCLTASFDAVKGDRRVQKWRG